MHEQLKKFWKDNQEEWLIQPMTAFFGSTLSHFLSKEKKKLGDAYDPQKSYDKYEETGIKGFIFENHIGFELVKKIAGDGLYVYAMRHGDDWCKPCDIENREVVVNFYAYFVTDKCLDHYFKPTKDWKKIYDWSMDWGDDVYWE